MAILSNTEWAWLRKLSDTGLILIAISMGMIGLYYLHDVYGGIIKHSPPCAPITAETVNVVYTFALFGIAISIFTSISARRRKLWFYLALLGCLLNIAVFAIWSFWNINETLLPYSDFCEKVGMG